MSTITQNNTLVNNLISNIALNDKVICIDKKPSMAMKLCSLKCIEGFLEKLQVGKIYTIIQIKVLFGNIVFVKINDNSNCLYSIKRFDFTILN